MLLDQGRYPNRMWIPKLAWPQRAAARIRFESFPDAPLAGPFGVESLIFLTLFCIRVATLIEFGTNLDWGSYPNEF